VRETKNPQERQARKGQHGSDKVSRWIADLSIGGEAPMASQEKKLRLVPIVQREKRAESLLEKLRPALGIEFSLESDRGVIKSITWPTGDECEYAIPSVWDVSGASIFYWETKSELPDFLPGFKIPLSRSWFDVLFKERMQSKRKIYIDDAYRIDTG
jgi:hypothetical protein